MEGLNQSFGNIYLSGRTRTKGGLSLSGDEIRWKGSGSSRVVTVPVSDIADIAWTQLGQFYQLKVNLNSGTHVRFQGFRSADKKSLDDFARMAIGKGLDVELLATNGWNWGNFDLKSSAMRFQVDDKLAFEVPFADVSQAVVQGKNELSLEFHQDDTVQNDEECLVEMRLYVPPSYRGAEDTEMDIDRAEEEENEEVHSSKRGVEKFHSEILERAQLGEHDDSIASFEEVLFITPRARYDLEMYSTYFKLHGKSYSYKILYKSVNRLFMLPRPGGQTTFVIGLDPAIRQGNTTYPFLQVSFKDEEEIELKPNLPADVIEQKFKGKLAETMTGTFCDILGRVVSAFTNRKINAPGSFTTAAGDKCVRCSHKANDGYLFPLEMSLFFIHKPPVYIRHEEISSVEFLRIGASASGAAVRTFDILMNLRSGEHLSFTGMNREEYKFLNDYFRAKKIKNLSAVSEMDGDTVTRSGRKSGKGSEAVVALNIPDQDDEEEDEDYKSDEEEEEDEDEYSTNDDDGNGEDEEDGKKDSQKEDSGKNKKEKQVKKKPKKEPESESAFKAEDVMDTKP